MRRKGNGFLFLLPVVLIAALMLSSGGDHKFRVGVDHSIQFRNPPSNIRKVITTPGGRQWRVDRHIQYTPQPCIPPNCPQ